MVREAALVAHVPVPGLHPRRTQVLAQGQPVDGQLQAGASGDRVVLQAVDPVGATGLVVDDHVDRPGARPRAIGEAVDPVDGAPEADGPPVVERHRHRRGAVVAEPELDRLGHRLLLRPEAGVLDQKALQVPDDRRPLHLPEEGPTGQAALGELGEHAVGQRQEAGLVVGSPGGGRPDATVGGKGGLLPDELLEDLMDHGAPVDGRDGHDLLGTLPHGDAQDALEEIAPRTGGVGLEPGGRLLPAVGRGGNVLALDPPVEPGEGVLAPLRWVSNPRAEHRVDVDQEVPVHRSVARRPAHQGAEIAVVDRRGSPGPATAAA